MSRPLFTVAVADLERGPKRLDQPIPVDWLAGVFAGTQASPRGEGRLSVELMKNGAEVVVRGHAEVAIDMPCVVTLDPLPFDLRPEILLMLAPRAPEPRKPKARGPERAPAKAAARAGGKAPAEGKGRRSGRGDSAWESDVELSERDAARDSFDGETVVLDEFLREFVLLELPLYPRRSDLPSDRMPAIAPASGRLPEGDPRLLPLAAIAERLREQQKKE